MRGASAAERPRNHSDFQFPEKMIHITISSTLSVLQLEVFTLKAKSIYCLLSKNKKIQYMRPYVRAHLA